MEIKAPRGTQDMLSERAQEWEYLEQTALKLFQRYGYQRIVTPTFEQTELFQRAIGEESEIVQKEMYTFVDRKGRSFALRPEGTAPIVRAYLEHNLAKTGQLVKLSYSGPMYRYERPQAGRYREFWQVGVEAIGSMDSSLDAEVILLSMHYLKLTGLKKLRLLLNSMGCKHCSPKFTSCLREYLKPRKKNLCPDCKKRVQINPLRVFDCQEESCQKILKKGPQILNYLCPECQAHFGQVQEYLKQTKVEFILEPFLVRGFDYYTKTTFEIQSPFLGAQNALGGGGRYDNLVEEYGGSPTPAIGFALGMERLILALKNEGVKFRPKRDIDVFLAAIGKEAKSEGFKLLSELRKFGIAADTNYSQKSLKAQMRLADKLGVVYTALLGSEELERGMCKIRDMKSGQQQEIVLKKAPQWLKSRLEGIRDG